MPDSRPIRLAVYAVVFDAHRRCLALRRSAANRSCVGCWEWPGGKPEPGEDLDTALRREVREECGLEVELLGLAGASEFDVPAARIIMVCLLARPTGGQLRLSTEHDAWEWTPLEILARRSLVEPMAPVLKNLLERKDHP